MEDKKKIALGAGVVAVVGVIILATKAKAAPPEEGPVTIGIEIIGPTGAVLARGPVALASLIEGENYVVRVTITNLSTKAGQPWEAVLNVRIAANIAGETILGPEVSDELFAPGETRIFDYPMYIPLGTGGLSGSIAGIVRDPAGLVLATATEPLTIITIEIIYGAEVVIGV